MMGPFGDGFFTTVVLHAFGPFYGGVFHSRVRVAEDVAPWVVGLLVACAVAWLVIVVVSRKGILAAFVGGWLAVILGTWAGNMASALVFIQTTKVPDDGPYSTQILVRRFDNGLHWGFLFGWFPALVAALLASVLHKREVTPVEPTQPTEHTGPTEHPWLTKHQGPTDDTGSRAPDDVIGKPDSSRIGEGRHALIIFPGCP